MWLEKNVNQDKIWDAYQNDPELSRVTWPDNARMNFIARRVPSSVCSVLNVGVGLGGLEERLVSRGFEVYCLDPSEKTIERMRSGLQLGERAKTGYAQNMPFENGFFDCVIMSEVLEHLESDVLEKTLREVHRILKVGGLFMGSVPADEALLESIVVCPNCGDRFHRWGHQQSFSQAGLEKLLRAHFSVIVLQRVIFSELGCLNWKGKVLTIFKKVQAMLNIKGSNQSFYFVCRKA